MVSKQVTVITGSVMTEGDAIFYEVRGQGQPLLMISGGGGDAGYYSLVADILADEYKVITYDRRGNSRSTRNDPQNFEISQQSRDAVAVLNAAGHKSAIVFGNSGGAVIALDLAKSHPQSVQAVIAHEPPVLGILPDHKKWFRFFSGIYRLTFTLGVASAMLRFGLSLKIPMKPNPALSKDFGKRMGRNNEFFLKDEMLSFIKYMPDIEMIKKNGVKIFMAAGKITLDAKKYYGITAPILANNLGCEMVTFPGHHISYLDRPMEWAKTLREVLQSI